MNINCDLKIVFFFIACTTKRIKFRLLWGLSFSLPFWTEACPLGKSNSQLFWESKFHFPRVFEGVISWPESLKGAIDCKQARKCEIKHWYACVADGRAVGVRQGWGWSTSPMAPGASFVYLLSSLVPRRSVLIRCPREVWERAGERTAFSASISRCSHSSW